MSGDTAIEVLVDGLSFPTSLTFDQESAMYVAESGLPFAGAVPGGRVWRIDADGKRTLIAGNLRPPVNGLVFHNGGLYVSEGGHPGRISRFELDGRQSVLLDNLPGPGNYHTNTVAFGLDGKMYFSQGSMTNTGIVELDAYEMGWLRRLPHAHDIPGYDNVPDLLFEVRQDAWYGWPDFIGGEPITHPKFLPTRGPVPTFLLVNHHELPEPEKPLLQFPPHTAPVKFDVAPVTVPNYAGHIYIVLFGDEAPMCLPAGGPRVGRSVGRIDPHDWSLHPVAMDSLNRPIDVRFGPADGALYVLDFGYFEMREGGGLDAEARSGKVWRVSSATYHGE